MFLLSISNYETLTGQAESIVEMLAMPADLDLESEKSNARSIKPLEFD